jgi:hypothetical protein
MLVPRLAFTCSLCAFFSWRGWSGQSVSQPAVTVLTIHAHTPTFYETSRMDACIPRASALNHLHCIMILPYGLQYWYDSTFLQKNAGVSCSTIFGAYPRCPKFSLPATFRDGSQTEIGLPYQAKPPSSKSCQGAQYVLDVRNNGVRIWSPTMIQGD